MEGLCVKSVLRAGRDEVWQLCGSLVAGASGWVGMTMAGRQYKWTGSRSQTGLVWKAASGRMCCRIRVVGSRIT